MSTELNRRFINHPKGNSSKSFDWTKVIGHNFTDDGESVYPPIGYFRFNTKHSEFSQADDTTLLFSVLDTFLDGTTERILNEVYIPALVDNYYHGAVLANSLVPFKNFKPVASGLHGSPSTDESGAVVPFTDHFDQFYDRYRVTSFDLTCRFQVVGHDGTSDDYGTTGFRGGFIIIDEEVGHVSAPTGVQPYYTQDQLKTLIRNRYKAGTLKTVPFSTAKGHVNAGEITLKANVIDQFLDKRYSRMAVPATATTPLDSSGVQFDVNDLENYMGRFSSSQGIMANDARLPKIRLWVVPFIVLTTPAGVVPSGGSAVDKNVTVLTQWEWTGHTQMTNPKLFTWETRD